ncbi:hypothetical protein MKJ04_13045 [Pontibacter sp. E15-1]|uniref:hypothetical protein n=1 Tax=Pontibacter sp. E15-1 TaxID=2919918 RepID=UPI001F500097|nr:hypothetical protein [Pontibacter sp. E15-1]MCJ8165773.1 hypothetical protein [Pontibacter sp. E15-1]
MQEISVRLFEGAYTLKPRAERRAAILAVLAVALQIGLLTFLALTKHFAPGLLFVFLVNLLVPAYYFFNLWLDRKPNYSRHLTLTVQGVCYRARFLQREQEFDWDEVDAVLIGVHNVTFILKNEEEHDIHLEHIQSENVLMQVKEQIREMVTQREIMLRSTVA